MPASQSKIAVSPRSGPPRSTRSQRLQAVVGDEAAAFDLALAAQHQRREAARLADRGDPVAVVRVLEAIDGVADQEAARAVEHLVGEIDARRQDRCGRPWRPE